MGHVPTKTPDGSLLIRFPHSFSGVFSCVHVCGDSRIDICVCIMYI